MIGAGIQGLDLVPADLRGLPPLAVERLSVELSAAAQVVSLRMRDTLPARLRNDVRTMIAVGDDSVAVDIYLTGSKARGWVLGFDGIVDVSAYVRLSSMAFGRPINSIVENVRAHQRHQHIAGHSALNAIAVEGGQLMAAIVAGLGEPS